MYLLDTMVLSEMRKKERNPGVALWLADKQDQELFVSVVSIGEIAGGIALQANKDVEFARILRQWFDKLLLVYSSRILPVDIPIAKRWGALRAQVNSGGVDTLLAATALEHNLSIVTRNERHFSQAGVAIINPWQ